VTSDQIVREWREAVGPIAGVETLTFGSQSRGPGGKPIEFKLLGAATEMKQLEAAVEETKQKLATYKGVFDVTDDSRPGKWELQLKEKQNAVAMGVPLESIARTVRASYYGEEVMRLQRGRHEVKLMVRYPEEDRKSLARFDDIRVDGGDGVQRPITELADVSVSRGYSEINRIDQKRSITVSSDISEKEGNAKEIVADLQAGFMPELLKKYPALRVRWEGQQEQDSESVRSLGIGLAIALLAMYVLLTMEFTSYGQPMVVMAIIPFGIVGAVIGHWVMGLPLTLFSTLGLVALTGIVVNDSIVLVDFINSAVRGGMPLQQAVLEAGARRFRPVMLTSLTTIAGLAPILTETSFQAQLVIPMAASLCFGLMTSTVLVLVLVPTFYLLYARMFGVTVDSVTAAEAAVVAKPELLVQQASV
jgi:multidrug efflux pump subunit AcrB